MNLKGKNNYTNLGKNESFYCCDAFQNLLIIILLILGGAYSLLANPHTTFVLWTLHLNCWYVEGKSITFTVLCSFNKQL